MGYPAGSLALSLDPGTLTRVRVGTATAIDVYSPLDGQLAPWLAHSPDKQIQDTTTATDVTLTEVPTDYVPVPVSGAGLHFPDITGGCDKFPFGIFCWVTDQLTTLHDTSPIPWHASVDFPSITVPGMPAFNVPAFAWDFASPGTAAAPFISALTGASYDGQGGFFGLIRNVLTFFLWLWGIWVYGKRKFGGKGLPDGDGDTGDSVNT
jgi:hypothetical protein